MFVARLVIDLAYPLSLVFDILLTKSDFPARIVGLGEAGRNFQRDRAEQCRIDAIVLKRRPQRDSACATRGGGVNREVAGKHRRRWNELSHVRRILPENGALITAEEKQFVLDDGT